MAADTKPMRTPHRAPRAAVIALAGAAGLALAQQTAPAPRRIVSLIPAVTEMLFAIGAGPQVIGVSSFDRHPPEALARTRLGGLIDPDVERILSLKPDLVIVYSTQNDLRAQLQRAGIPLFPYEHAGLTDIGATIRLLGSRVGLGPAGMALADSLDAAIANIRRRIAGRRRPRTLLVFGRDNEVLRGIFASGGRGFLHDMLTTAGGDNVFADVARESIQATIELIITRAPDVIIEISAAPLGGGEGRRNLGAWDALGSVPAVRTRRIYLLVGDELVIPGPRMASATRRLAKALHPDAF